MSLVIKKRNGKEVEFDAKKIEEAVKKAMLEIDEKRQDKTIPELVTDIVVKQCYNGIDVEKIQDLVVSTLLGLGYHEIANHYISYRAVRSHERELSLSKLYNRMGDIVEFGDNENSNKNYKLPSVKRDTIAGEYFRNKLFEVLPKHIADAHRNKLIHWHDSDVDPKLTNCFSRDTTFITDKGVKSFFDFEHGDSVRVLTHTGKFRNAVVKHYGKQLLNEVFIKRGKLIYSKKCTNNHRWILSNGKITTNLEVGDSLYHTDEYFDLFDINQATLRQKELWCRGFILGDGNVTIVDGRPYTRVRFCGHKKEKSYIFEECGFKVNKNNYTKTDYLSHIPGDLKTIPYDLLLTEDDIVAYVAGFLYADGGIGLNKNGTSYRSIYAKDNQVQNFIEKYFPVAGVYITSQNDLTNKKSNYKRNGSPKEYHLLTKISKYKGYNTKVISINKNISYEDVWCLEVDTDHSFVFPDGICTGNCCLVNIYDMLKNGTRVTNADIETPKSVGTAMNIAMQIMASVSASQYGGVSLPNFNEVFAEYAKINFKKNFLEYYEFMYEKEYDDTLIIDSSNNELMEKYSKIFTKAKNKTKKEIYDACQLFEYQTNSILGSAS